MSETELNQIRKRKIKKTILLILIIVAFGAIITTLFIIYFNINTNEGG
ncbi:MAG: hypothetical protein KAT57_06690 [Candidatus Lokiarchaeota archaeon]|nr:hypothetical protein [Candidatus Lokiarchaeota archaeon]